MENHNNQILNQATAKVFFPLIVLLDQIDEDDYQMQIKSLKGNTIGKHVRHIIEFYLCLLDGYAIDYVNYDNRKRNLILETKPHEALQYLQSIQNRLVDFKNKDLNLANQLGTDDTTLVVMKSNWQRELVYNIEHTTHHLAIINIALKENFPCIKLPENFGVAVSTLRFQSIPTKNKLEVRSFDNN